MSASASLPLTATQRDFRKELADAYGRVALSGADMFRAVTAIEAIRSVLVDRRTGLRALDTLDDQVALADEEALRRALDDLRAVIKRAILDEQRAQLEALARDDPGAAAAEWMQAYGAALRFWRIDVCTNLAETRVELGDPLPPREQMARWTRLLEHERFAETLELFELLGGYAAYEPTQRARFLVYAAQVQLYHLRAYQAALELVRRAEALAPDDPIVVIAIGEHRLETGDVEGAKEQFAKALPSDEAAEACRLMGDACAEAGDLDEAERWYIQAIGYGPGQASSYMRLAAVYGRRGGLSPGDVRLESLVERAVSGDPTSEYSVWVTIGGVHAEAGAIDAARSWYERAIALDPTRIRAYLADGNLLAGADRLDEAEPAFLRAVELAPDAFDGYWGLAWLYERAGRLEEALERYRESLPLRPAWRELVVARIGATLRGLDQIDEAEEMLLDELRTAQEGGTVLAELHALVDEHYQRRSEPDRARGLLEQIRAISGDSYEANFQNRLGNVAFWVDDYPAAAECYRRSLAASPQDSVVHRNLAGAYRELRLWDEATQELEQAFDLDHDESADRHTRALLLNGQGIAFFESGDYEAARERYEQAVELAPQDVVMHTNLALAWLAIWRPGERRAGLEAARAAVRRARELDPGNESATENERMIAFELRLLDELGEPEPIAGLRPRTIAVEVASDLVPLITIGEGEELTPAVQAATADFRERVRRSADLTPPGIRYAENESLPASTYELRLLESPHGRGVIEAGAVLFRGDTDLLVGHGVEHRGPFLAVAPPAWWVGEADADRLRSAGLEILDPVSAMLLHLEEVLAPLLRAG